MLNVIQSLLEKIAYKIKLYPTMRDLIVPVDIILNICFNLKPLCRAVKMKQRSPINKGIVVGIFFSTLKINESVKIVIANKKSIKTLL